MKNILIITLLLNSGMLVYAMDCDQWQRYSGSDDEKSDSYNFAIDDTQENAKYQYMLTVQNEHADFNLACMQCIKKICEQNGSIFEKEIRITALEKNSVEGDNNNELSQLKKDLLASKQKQHAMCTKLLEWTTMYLDLLPTYNEGEKYYNLMNLVATGLYEQISPKKMN